MQRARFRSVAAGVSASWQLQALQGVDPTMALYAGYAYFATQEPDLIDQMDKAVLFQWAGSSWFDLAMLMTHDTATVLAAADRVGPAAT